MNEHTEKLSPIERKTRELADKSLYVVGEFDDVVKQACLEMAKWVREELAKKFEHIAELATYTVDADLQANYIREWGEK